MNKLTAALAVATLAASTASAATITAGTYTFTNEYTALNDPGGVCAVAGVSVGGKTTGIATVAGDGGAIQTIAFQPATSSPYKVNTLTCNYSALPATIATTGSTPYSGTTSCVTTFSPLTGGAGAYTVTADPSDGSSGSAINTIVLFNALATRSNSFKITSTNVLVSAPGVGPLCHISVDSLFQRSGV